MKLNVSLGTLPVDAMRSFEALFVIYLNRNVELQLIIN